MDTTVLLLVAVAFCAGFVDAIAGGGGLLTLPALLTAGLPPHLALGTNKGQSVFGSGSALVSFWRRGLVDPTTFPGRFAAGFVGSLAGAWLVTLLSPTILRPLVLVSLVVVGVALAARPPLEVVARDRPPMWAVWIALAVGAYDGFFGPGTGTFLIVAQVWLLGFGLVRASAEAKVVNFASNLAALLVFAAKGHVALHYAVPMGAAQLVGGALGSAAAVKGGDRVIRWVVVGVVTALVAKLGWDATR